MRSHIRPPRVVVVIAIVACGLSGTRIDWVASRTRPSNPSCIAPPRPAAAVRVVRAFSNLRFDQPTALVPSPDGAWWFLAERQGRVWRFASDERVAVPELVLDLTDRVNATSEAIGLLAFALHPDFETTGALFVSYTGFGGAAVMSRVARFVSRDGGRSFDRAREDPILNVDQVSAYHVNADLRFGPDGYLYIGFGDGGPQGDPLGRAQDPQSRKGKILRIDVDGKAPYAIPADNPFARAGGAPEVWALGLRNPWRFAFDRATGELWAGDVGGDQVEEIDRIVRGGNYGWNVREGTRCMPGRSCGDRSLIDPVVALAHPEASSITFGLVYRGSKLPALAGHLIYGDYASGGIWAVDPKQTPPAPRLLHAGGQAPVAFAEDADGEALLVDYQGSVWRLVPGEPGPADVPPVLSATGCFQRGGVANPGLIPYEINAELWADGASKQRWFAIPDGTKIRVDAKGHLELPIGSVTAKEFRRGGKRIETRLFVRHLDGAWAGYTYRWDAAQQDATLLPLAAMPVTAAASGRWYYPHRGECLRCHQAAAGYTLGLELSQLARRIERADEPPLDQLAAFDRMQLFADPLPRVEPLPSTAELSTTRRARAWLHANCSYCHRPGATGQGNMDLRYGATLAEMNLCDVEPQFGSYDVAGVKRIVSGQPGRSTLSLRIRAQGFLRMPPLGTFTHDPMGRASVDAWILGLACGTPGAKNGL